MQDTYQSREWLAHGLCVAALAILLTGGCTVHGPTVAVPTTASGECEALFLTVDAAVERTGARDYGPVPVAGFPWLRADRFLASFGQELSDPKHFAVWLSRLAERDAAARAVELQNGGGRVAGLGPEALQTELDRCRHLLMQRVRDDPELSAQLQAAVAVPDDYVTAWRVAGLYPITATFVAGGISRWHEESARTFAVPLDELPVDGRLQRWRAPHPQRKHSLYFQYDALGIPRPSETELRTLFMLHAPTWEVDVVDSNDLIGTPVAGKNARVSTSPATQYHYTSYTRFGENILLQLNYVIWFPARPGDDIYAGNIDGLTWRVTLGPDGEPWLYDSIHNCGCYHMYFPTGRLKLRDDLPALGFEPPLVPQPAPEPPVVVRIESGRHYIQRVYRNEGEHTAPDMATLQLTEADYDRLRSLPVADRYRSLFGRHGLIQGTERGERFLLWPMGVRSPGAMRQRGHHPVAFVGRRHFDDPRLIEELFKEQVE